VIEGAAGDELPAPRAATLLVGPGVGTCVLGFVAEASEEAAGGELPQPKLFIGFQAQLLPAQPPVLQPVVIVTVTSTRPVAKRNPVNRVLRMGGESFLSPPGGACKSQHPHRYSRE
jgi:hypothetical protein